MSLDTWTFGITTGGDAYDRVNQMIGSIEHQRIPNDKYEIIIIGGRPIDRQNCIHIPFDENIKRQWITKKKNIICQKAKFENIVLTHDYVMFKEGWYDNWIKYADNNWDVAMNAIKNGDGTRYRDWVTDEPLWLIDYYSRAFLKCMYISGTYWCAKKSFMLKYPLNENKSWGEGEDVEWSRNIRNFWNYKCNPYSIVQFAKNNISWINPDLTFSQQINNFQIHIKNAINYNNPVCVIEDRGYFKLECNPNIISINCMEFDYLRQRIRELKPQRTLIIGGADGFSAFSIGWGAKDYGGSVVVVDPFVLPCCNTIEDIKYNLSNKIIQYDCVSQQLIEFLNIHFELNNITVKSAYIEDCFQELGKYDCIFIDTTVVDNFRFKNINIAKNLLNHKGIIIINTRNNPLNDDEKSALPTYHNAYGSLIETI